MDKIKCVAIDDEPFALEIIADDISKIPYLELVGKFNDAKSALEILDRVDLLFLDIQMPTQLGTSFLKSLENPPMVIFTTAYEQYALEGFDLKVLDYLVKPIPFDRFLQATDHALNQFKLKKNIVNKIDFQVYSDYKKINIDTDKILYIEGMKDYVKIYLISESKPIITRMNLKAISEKLPESNFIRIHNSFIIAINQLKSYNKSSVLVGQKELPIGSKFLDVFLNLQDFRH